MPVSHSPIMPTLTTGWEPDTATTDALVRQYLFGWAELCEAFAVAAGGRTTRRDTFAATDYRRAGGYFNSATLLAPPGPGTLDEIEDFFTGSCGQALLWSAWPTPDLHNRGWQLEGHPPLMIRPPAAMAVPPAAPIDVEVVTGAAGLAEWERVAVEGYPMPELLPVTTGALAGPELLTDPRLRFTLSRHGGAPVSIGSLFTTSDLGIFVLGVTRPEARRRGHWLAHAVHRLTAVPQLWTAGVFSDYCRSPAQHLGFVPVLRLTLWSLPRLR